MQIIFENQEYSWSNTSLEEFLKSNTPSGWIDFFNREDIKDMIHTISNFLAYEASHNITIYPSITNVFRSLYSIDLDNVDVIIIGQDPYHDGAATGLAFDVYDYQKPNPSLRNIIKELKSSGYETSTNLSVWPEQGVLLLNTALTVRQGSPGTHTEIWNEFTEKLIKYIGERNQLIWLLMGNHAQQFAKILPNGKKHICINTTHPSPLSALRSTKRTPAFIGSECFKTINEHLINIGKESIRW